MKFILKIGFLFIGIIAITWACNTSQQAITTDKTASDSQIPDTIRLVNEEVEYELIIIDTGFESWLITQKPISYYNNNTLRIKNYQYVVEWNIRASQPLRYNPSLYEMTINYDPNIDYGKELNYKLFQYFQFFQQKYRQKLM